MSGDPLTLRRPAAPVDSPDASGPIAAPRKADAAVKLVLLRHGKSLWNRQRRFTGWADVALSSQGVAEARRAAQAIKHAGIRFDVCFTSYLKRAIKTLWIVLEANDQMWLPVHNSWRLNERHYGVLEGLDRRQTRRRFGAEQAFAWMRHYAVSPPALSVDDARFPGRDPRYAGLAPGQVPLAESLKDTQERVLPYWHEAVAPELLRGRNVLIVAHGNVLRALAMHLETISEADIPHLKVPTGQALVYDLDAELRPLSSGVLSAPGRIEVLARRIFAG